VNIGVMRFNGVNGSGSGDSEYQGGVITNGIKDLAANRNTIISTVNGFSPNSGTPLTEMLYEAGLYWAGQTPQWGNNGSADGSIISGGKYVSPIAESCQRNFNILLTDGRPSWDNQADTFIEGSGGLYGGACSGQPGEPSLGPDTGSPPDSRNAGRCLDEMANYLARDTTDLSPLTGNQRVKTFTIGFGGNDPSAFTFLGEVATDGGGTRYLANNVAGLNKALQDIATEIANISSTFATASIGVNSFNRAATRDDLYFAVFNSDDHLRWDGNLKKYKLGTTVDPDGAGPLKPRLIIVGTAPNTDVIGSDGFFIDGSQSFWSGVTDGKNVTMGGAASLLPAAASRTVLTHLGSNPAGSFANLIPIDAAAVDDAALDTTATGTPNRAAVLAFAKGGTPKRMGDPLHSQPSVVTYSGTATSPVDVVYTATNDGYLHAVDGSTGVEKWAFVPEELLKRLKQLVIDPTATTRTYGLDGDIRILKLDFNGDGDVDTADGDVVWLYVGMRRGGRYYYALNVTNPNSPQLMWKDSVTELPDLGETWSAPTIARVAVSGASQNNQKLVLIFGGGYDGSQENTSQVADGMGNSIYMVDAKTGTRLWSASDSGHNLNLASMTNSIPGRVSVIDINGDGYADRMYAADMGGRIFRFDIFSGNAPATLVTGGVFAKLGTGAAAGGNDSPAPIANTRRFYNAPDVALIQRRGADPYYNLAIGSGYRGHPLHRPTLDRFYSLRDKQPYTKYTTNPTAAQLPVITDADPVDITPDPMAATVGTGAVGWKLVFDPTGTSTTATGEKVLNEATTVNGVVLFSTYAPQTASPTEPCRPTSLNKVYALRVDNGHPALDLNGDGVINNSDKYENVIHEGILGGVNVGVLRGTLADALGGTPTVCLAGMHILGKCVNVSDSIRTYWRKDADTP
jgi:type IV pilus assembly protein PilY1